jgi:hypothetical protein
MNSESDPNFSNAIEEPRRRRDFQPQFYPNANGKEAPAVDAPGRNDRLVLEFLAVYYELNLAYHRLVETRQAPASPERKQAEKKCLQSVERLLILRDSLEDQFAPLGVIAEPVVQSGVTVNVKFSFGTVDAGGRRRSDWFTITTCVPVPLPPGVTFEELPIQIEGPGINPE